MSAEILKIKDLRTYFYADSGIIKAVDGISLSVKKQEAFGLVGGSGSGKTLAALSILNLVPYPGRIAGGEILFKGRDILKMSEDALAGIRGAKISMVSQEPSNALDPVFTAGSQVSEAVSAHRIPGGRDRVKEIVLKHLSMVRIPDPERVYNSYPHQLSGGTKQRVMIAMALINSPELVILDEPTTALDVTIQAEILELLDEIIRQEGLSIIFISHDLGIVARMCRTMAVMHKGRIVEAGATADILSHPKDDYTVSLMESVKALG